MDRKELQSEIDQYEIDQFFIQPMPDTDRGDDIIQTARVGWARPATLSLDEVQALCRALVMMEAGRKRAA